MSHDHKQRILDYYDATHIDYRVLWSKSGARAVHFGYYDQKNKTHKKAIIRMNAVLAEAVDITSEDSVLDAGCGYGGSGMWLAEKYGCTVKGLTLSPLQANKGSGYIKNRGLEDKVEVMLGDYTHIPFEDETFDVFWALESLVHSEDRARVLKEAMRVLKPGGRIVIAEYILREDPPLSPEENEFLSPWLHGWAMPELISTEEFKIQLKKSGFLNIKIEDVTEHIRPSLGRLKILSMLTYPIAILIAPIFFRKQRLENYYASRRQVKALERGLWKYEIITATKE